MTDNERALNAETARELAAAVDQYIGDTIEYTILSSKDTDYVMRRVLHTLNQQQKLIEYLLLRDSAREGE